MKMPRIKLGPYCPPIAEQCKAPRKMTGEWQKVSDAIILLWLHDYVTEKQKHTMSQKLLKKIKAYFDKLPPEWESVND